MEFDVLLRHGRVIDGTGAPARRADVGVTGGRITAIDDLSAATAAVDLDVTGRVVTPGFVDVHAHTDVANLYGDGHEAMNTAGIRQGVTTEVCGNCGASPFPRALGRDPNEALFPPGLGGGWDRLADYRDDLATVGMAANLAPLLGHGSVRAAVVGHDARPPTADELARMVRVTEQAMDDGAFGLSSGLIYAPGMFADTEELVALAAVVGRRGRPYTTHMRDEASRLADAVDEALAIGRGADTGVQISHHKAAGRANWGATVRTRQQLDAARRSGTDVTIDVYPYTAGSTHLRALLPPWALDGGVDAMVERLRSSTARDRIRRDLVDGIDGWQRLEVDDEWRNVVVAGEPPLAGLTVGDIAADRGRDPVDVLADVLLDDPTTMMMIHMMDPAEVRSLTETPFAMVGSDGIPVPGHQHPRLAGTFARVLGWNADDESRLVDLVRRMTALPADRFRLPDRGRLVTRAVADVVVFDPLLVEDRATYDEPLLHPEGIEHVLVAGDLTVRDGRLTPARNGRVLEPA